MMGQKRDAEMKQSPKVAGEPVKLRGTTASVEEKRNTRHRKKSTMHSDQDLDIGSQVGTQRTYWRDLEEDELEGRELGSN